MTIETHNEWEAQFLEACQAHDLTYMYSDDFEVYRRGQTQRERIEELSKHIPQTRRADIWNAIVDTKLLENARESFYWRMR